jgi:hypothetical protein
LVLKKSEQQCRNPGDVVRIALGDGFHAYARVMKEATFAVYNAHVPDTQELPLAAFHTLPILFHIAVMDHAVKKGRWKILGNISPEMLSTEVPPKFIQDPLDRTNFSIYRDGQIRRATREECIGLECAAVWEPEHVEDRIRDHYAGRPNKWSESMKIKD